VVLALCFQGSGALVQSAPSLGRRVARKMAQKGDEPLARQLVDYFARPGGLDEMTLLRLLEEEEGKLSPEKKALLIENDDDDDDDDLDDEEEEASNWLVKLFSLSKPPRKRLRETEVLRPVGRKKALKRTARKLLRKVEDLVPASVWKEVKVAKAVLFWWADRRGDVEGWRCVEFGARVAAYMAETPFRKDAAVLASALLSESFRKGDLDSSLVRVHVGNETASMSTALANLEQLSELQRARWDAEGDHHPPDPPSPPPQNQQQQPLTIFDDDGERFEDDELLYSCRLPPTHARNLRHMLVAVATDFRALPLLLARRLVALRDERDAFHAEKEAVRRNAILNFSALEKDPAHQKAGGGVLLIPHTRPSPSARDALDVYAPLAERFGLYSLKNDLEDAAFDRLAPLTRRRIKSALDASREARTVVLDDVARNLRFAVLDEITSDASLRVDTREKEPYSVWRKQHKLRSLRRRKLQEEQENDDDAAAANPFLDASWWSRLRHLDEHDPPTRARRLERKNDQDDDDDDDQDNKAAYPRVLYPLDTVALRVVLEPRHPTSLTGEELCYDVLRLVHSTWKPLPNRIKDYVARPKPNGYQSLHTTVLMRWHRRVYPFEIQVRTRDMHSVAEFGSAAHVLYSRGGSAAAKEQDDEFFLDDDNKVVVRNNDEKRRRKGRGHLGKKDDDDDDDDDDSSPQQQQQQQQPPTTTTRPRRRRRNYVLDDAGVPFRTFDAAPRTPRDHVRVEHSRRARAILDEIRGDGGVVVEREAAPIVVVQRRRQKSRLRQNRRSEAEARARLEATLASTTPAGEPDHSGFFPDLFRVRGDFVDDAVSEGAQLGASLGERLRSDRVFVLASGGRVLIVDPRKSDGDVLDALRRDLRDDARRGPGNRVVVRRPVGPLEINARRHTYISALEPAKQPEH